MFTVLHCAPFLFLLDRRRSAYRTTPMRKIHFLFFVSANPNFGSIDRYSVTAEIMESEQEAYFYSWSKEDADEACQAMIPPGKSFSEEGRSSAVPVAPFNGSKILNRVLAPRTLKANLLNNTPINRFRCAVPPDSSGRDEGGDAASRSSSGSAGRNVTTGEEFLMAMDCLKSLESAEFEIFNDPVHGSIELHPLLVSIVHTPAFNRLKNIKQLGGVHYVYHGATHTRFEHSIGTCHIAGEFVRRLQRKQPELGITDNEVLLVEIAALCHDLGHGPLSYVFINEKKKLSSLIFDHIYKFLEDKDKRFSSYGINGPETLFIQELIDHDLIDRLMVQPDRQFLYEIVANKESGIDVAKWDYIARDCHYLGIPNEFDWRRLMKLSRVIKVNGVYRICYRDKEVNNLYGMFRTRVNLFRRAYKHTTVLSIEHMIGNAIEKVKSEKLLRDESDTSQLVSVEDALCGVTKDTPNLGGFLALTDSIIPLILNSPNQSPAVSAAKDILRKLDSREILHLAAKDVSNEPCSITKEALLATIHQKFPASQVGEVHFEQVVLSYCSEKAHNQLNTSWNKDDPVNQVYFYKKETPWKAVLGGVLFDSMACQQSFSPSAKRSDLVIPQTFEVKETLVYSEVEKKRKLVESAYGEAKQAAKRRRLDTSSST